MLTIRKSQMKIFQNDAERNFLTEILERLRYSHSAAIKGMEDAVLHKRVAHGITCARGYGLTWKTNLTVFVMLMLDLGPGFDRYPTFLKCLTDINLEPDERMGVLLTQMTEDDWWRARQIPSQWPEGVDARGDTEPR